MRRRTGLDASPCDERVAREASICQGPSGLERNGCQSSNSYTSTWPVDLVAPTATSSDQPLDTIDTLKAALTDDLGAELESIGEIVTAIGPAKGFNYTVENQDALDRDVAFLRLDGGGWDPFPFGEFWLLDTDRGLFMVTAEAVRDGPLLDEAVVTARRLLETIEFVEVAAE